jgi:hypothetical protein
MVTAEAVKRQDNRSQGFGIVNLFNAFVLVDSISCLCSTIPFTPNNVLLPRPTSQPLV